MWDWTLGSRLFFWRWAAHQQHCVWDGYVPWIQSPLPQYRRPQPLKKDDEVREKVAAKPSAIQNRKYIWKGEVQSLTSYFSVPKGE